MKFFQSHTPLRTSHPILYFFSDIHAISINRNETLIFLFRLGKEKKKTQQI